MIVINTMNSRNRGTLIWHLENIFFLTADYEQNSSKTLRLLDWTKENNVELYGNFEGSKKDRLIINERVMDARILISYILYVLCKEQTHIVEPFLIIGSKVTNSYSAFLTHSNSENYYFYYICTYSTISNLFYNWLMDNQYCKFSVHKYKNYCVFWGNIDNRADCLLYKIKWCL